MTDPIKLKLAMTIVHDLESVPKRFIFHFGEGQPNR